MIVTSFGEFANKEEIIEHMHRQIIENGGKIVPATSKHSSHYIIIEDGVESKIWEMIGTGNVVDSKNRKIIHFRWVQQCIKKN
jgi:BRCT domain, a BRCA1 C-terminus domain